MTCHNRREKTLYCLEKLFKQVLKLEVSIQVYLLDDGSTDGTTEAVLAIYPEVKIFKGNGRLFWNGGMRFVFSEAFNTGYDYYLWLNDDTMLECDALQNLLATHHFLAKQDKPNSIVVGSTRDLVTGELTYGGVVRSSFWHPLKFKLVKPNEMLQMSVTMNGNCVLIPHVVAKNVGTLDDAFTHAMGDYDYGLRAEKLGCLVWVAPGYAGTCSRNFSDKSWTDPKLPFCEQLKKLGQPKELPLLEWKIFAKRHAGMFWFVYWLFPYMRIVASLVFRKLWFQLAGR